MYKIIGKARKIPTHIRQIIAECLGSIAGILFFIDLLSGIFGLTHGVIRLIIILGCFILIPSVFAFPIIIRRKTLILIPVIIFPLVLILFYIGSYPKSILDFCFILTIIACFGMISGLIIRAFLQKKGIFKAFGFLLLLTPFLLVGYVLAGSPFHAIPVSIKVNNYVKEVYSDFDVSVGFPYYDWYDGKYISKIYDKDDKDIYFEIWYGENWQTGEMQITDRYPYGYSWADKNNPVAGRRIWG